jgi:hypothetical protein
MGSVYMNEPTWIDAGWGSSKRSDWSRGLFAEETELGHSTSKFIGGLVLETAAGSIIAKTGIFSKLMNFARICFIAGTQVKTLDGGENIEDIEIGDLVWSRDPLTGEFGYKPVVELYVTHPDQLIHLEYGDDEELIGTAEHPFWVVEKQAWIRMADVEPGDTLVLDDGTLVTVTGSWIELAPEGETFTTYNFQVADWHTYFVSPAIDLDDDGYVWVHNTGAELGVRNLARAEEAFLKYKALGKGEAYLRRMGKWTRATVSQVDSVRNYKYLTSARRAVRYLDKLHSLQRGVINSVARQRIAEAAGRVEMARKGFFKIGHGVYNASGHGIDAIFENTAGEIGILESKYRRIWTAGRNMKYAMGKGYGAKQMSKNWIREVGKRMLNSDFDDVVKMGNKILNQGYQYRFVNVFNMNGESFINKVIW